MILAETSLTIYNFVTLKNSLILLENSTVEPCQQVAFFAEILCEQEDQKSVKGRKLHKIQIKRKKGKKSAFLKNNSKLFSLGQ